MPTLPLWRIVAMLSFCFANGCLLVTYFLITLPIESARMVPPLCYVPPHPSRP